MRKLGQINDAHLLKKAAGNVKAENGVKQLIAGKIAMFDQIITAGEKISATKMSKEAKAALIESASSYMPASQMLEPYDKVVKQAQLLVTRLFAQGLSKKGESLMDKQATAFLQKKRAEYLRKKAAGGIDNVGPDGIISQLDGSTINYDPAAGPNDENATADQLYADSFAGKEDTGIYDVGEINVDEIMQMLAEGNSGLNDNMDMSIPYPDIFDIKEGAADIDQHIMNVLKKAEALMDKFSKKAEVSTELPAGDSASNAEATEKEFNKDVDTKPSTNGTAVIDAGASMDDIAEVSELEKLIEEGGAEGADQTNKITSVNPAETPDGEKKVSNNIFRNIIKKV